MSKVCIFDIKVSNLKSVVNSLELVGHHVSSIDRWDPSDGIPDVDLFMLPGVGSFDSGMHSLSRSGLDKLIYSIHKHNLPLVGICLGMQLFLELSSESRTGIRGLGIIKGNVRRINHMEHKVPNIGWYENHLSHTAFNSSHKILKNNFYFIHSYYCDVAQSIQLSRIQISNQTSITSSYYSSRVLGLQFHPEKSHESGLNLLSELPSFFQ